MVVRKPKVAVILVDNDEESRYESLHRLQVLFSSSGFLEFKHLPSSLFLQSHAVSPNPKHSKLRVEEQVIRDDAAIGKGMPSIAVDPSLKSTDTTPM